MSSDLQELLRQHGFAPVKAELWSKFVQHVLSVFQDAAGEMRRPENWEKFRQKNGALGVPRTLKRRKAIRRIPIEDAITSELAIFMQQARRAVPKGHFLRLHEVEFHPEHPVPSDTRAGRHSRKVDFYVCAATGEGAPELAIEAKPLAKESDITGRYLADEGIGCFLTDDSPYTHGPLGAMLAYTISSQGRSWRAEIRAAVKTYQPKVLKLEDATIAGLPEPMTLSRHDRGKFGLQPIAILHFEMIFAPDIQDAPES